MRLKRQAINQEKDICDIHITKDSYQEYKYIYIFNKNICIHMSTHIATHFRAKPKQSKGI